MNPDKFAGNIKNYKTKEEMRAAFLEQVNEGNNWQDRMETLTSAVEEYIPGRISQNPHERERRRKVSQRMRKKMLAVFEKEWERGQYQKDKTVNRDKLQRDEWLILDVCDSIEEYRRRGEILNGQDTEEKTGLAIQFIASMAHLFLKYRKTPLNSLTDEQIADNFEEIYMLNELSNQLLTMLENPHLKFDKQVAKYIRDLDEEFSGPISCAYLRAKQICQPYYELFPTSAFVGMTWDNFNDLHKELFNHMKEREAANYIEDYIHGGDMTGSAVAAESDLKRTELKGYRMEDILWMDDKGRKLETIPNRNGKIGFPGDEILKYGKPLTAMFPDNTIKVFQIDFNGQDRRCHSTTLQVQTDLSRLLDGIKDADPLYVRSSDEFKDVKLMLENLNKEIGPNPPMYKRKKMEQQMAGLMEACSRYLDTKELKTREKGPNSLETRRMNAVRAVLDFARVNQMKKLKEERRAQAHYNPKEAELFQQSENSRKARQDAFSEQWEKLRDYKGDMLPDKEKLLSMISSWGQEDLLKLNEYTSSPAQDNRFYQNTSFVEQLGEKMDKERRRLMKAIADSYDPNILHIPSDMQNKIRRKMAKMLSISVIRHEAENSDGKNAISLFEMYEKNPEQVMNDIMDEPSFCEAMDNITPKSIADFCLQNRFAELGHTIAREMPKRLEREAQEEAERQKWAEEYARRNKKFIENQRAITAKVSSYAHMNIPDSDKCSLVNKLKVQVAINMSVQYSNGDREYLGLPENEVRRNLAKMTALELILLERGDQKENIKAGQAEISLQEQGIEKFAEAIEQHPLFQKETQTLTPETYMDFVVSNKAKKVGGEIFAEAIERSRQLSQNKTVQNNETHLDDRKLTEEHKNTKDNTHAKDPIKTV